MSVQPSQQYESLTDYSEYHYSKSAFQAVAPKNIDELEQVLSEAHQRQQRIRLRARHHSMNGSSLPKNSDELLVYTTRLNHYCFEKEGTITVGTGAAILEVDQFLRRRNFRLRLTSDGGFPAPSVGGFVSAGGIGEATHEVGGFWETVREIRYFEVDGTAHLTRPGDMLFSWLFGSMGQLVVVSEVVLDIVPLEPSHASAYPLDESGVILHTPHNWERNYWLTFFIPEEENESAMATLKAFGDQFDDCWTRREDYLYPIPFKTFHPPLIFPRAINMSGAGVWGSTPVEGRFDFDKLKKIEAAADELHRSQPTWNRYIQTEMSFTPRDWSAIFGQDTFRTFQALKKELDPEYRLNPGLID